MPKIPNLTIPQAIDQAWSHIKDISIYLAILQTWSVQETQSAQAEDKEAEAAAQALQQAHMIFRTSIQNHGPLPLAIFLKDRHSVELLLVLLHLLTKLSFYNFHPLYPEDLCTLIINTPSEYRSFENHTPLYCMVVNESDLGPQILAFLFDRSPHFKQIFEPLSVTANPLERSETYSLFLQAFCKTNLTLLQQNMWASPLYYVCWHINHDPFSKLLAQFFGAQNPAQAEEIDAFITEDLQGSFQFLQAAAKWNGRFFLTTLNTALKVMPHSPNAQSKKQIEALVMQNLQQIFTENPKRLFASWHMSSHHSSLNQISTFQILRQHDRVTGLFIEKLIDCLSQPQDEPSVMRNFLSRTLVENGQFKPNSLDLDSLAYFFSRIMHRLSNRCSNENIEFSTLLFSAPTLLFSCNNEQKSLFSALLQYESCQSVFLGNPLLSKALLNFISDTNRSKELQKTWTLTAIFKFFQSSALVSQGLNTEAIAGDDTSSQESLSPLDLIAVRMIETLLSRQDLSVLFYAPRGYTTLFDHFLILPAQWIIKPTLLKALENPAFIAFLLDLLSTYHAMADQGFDQESFARFLNRLIEINYTQDPMEPATKALRYMLRENINLLLPLLSTSDLISKFLDFVTPESSIDFKAFSHFITENEIYFLSPLLIKKISRALANQDHYIFSGLLVMPADSTNAEQTHFCLNARTTLLLQCIEQSLQREGAKRELIAHHVALSFLETYHQNILGQPHFLAQDNTPLHHAIFRALCCRDWGRAFLEIMLRQEAEFVERININTLFHLNDNLALECVGLHQGPHFSESLFIILTQRWSLISPFCSALINLTSLSKDAAAAWIIFFESPQGEHVLKLLLLAETKKHALKRPTELIFSGSSMEKLIGIKVNPQHPIKCYILNLPFETIADWFNCPVIKDSAQPLMPQEVACVKIEQFLDYCSLKLRSMGGLRQTGQRLLGLSSSSKTLRSQIQATQKTLIQHIKTLHNPRFQECLLAEDDIQIAPSAARASSHTLPCTTPFQRHLEQEHSDEESEEKSLNPFATTN